MAITRQNQKDEFFSSVYDAGRRFFSFFQFNPRRRKKANIEDVTGFFNPEHDIRDMKDCSLRPFEDTPVL